MPTPSSYGKRVFGVTSAPSGVMAGIIANSYSENASVDVAEARNEVGTVIDLAPYSKNSEISVKGVYYIDAEDDRETVAPGDVVTIGEKDYLISNVTRDETNTGFQELSVTARHADDAIHHTLSSVQQMPEEEEP